MLGRAWAMLAVAFAGHAAWGQPGGGPPPAKVIVDDARTEMLEQRREVTGALRSPRRSQLASQQAGLVVELKVDEGDTVAEGTPIAKLDTKLAELAVVREQANVKAKAGTIAEREAQVEKAKRDQSRVDEMAARASANPTEIDDARTNVTLAEARLAQAQADLASAEGELARARERLRQMTIIAPFAGRVVKRWTQIGQWVQEGDSVVEIVALDQIEARLDVPEHLIARLITAPPGTDGASGVIVRVRALSEDFSGGVMHVVPDADPLSRLFPVRVMLANPGEKLKPGMSVVATVPTGQREMLTTVRKDAILRDDAGEYLYFDMNGMAMVARVKTLFAVGERVVLDKESKLPPGAKVVVQGNERLFPMQPLEILGGADAAPAK